MPMKMGPWELVLVVTILLLLFGSKRIPQIARDLGRSLKELRRVVRS